MNRLVFVRIIIRRIIYISRTIVDKYVLNYKNGCKLFQGGQSRCLADWVHELYEPVIGQHMSGKSFKLLLYKVKFHAVEYKKKPHVFLHQTVLKFLLGSCSFPVYLEQMKCVPNRGEFSFFLHLGNYSKPRRNFDTVMRR